ncbi:MAG TPA: EcsC family protein [Accumulibacter sp.]|nr:EcsC family protein [Accumulibacter sp.]HMW17253.1 EcsC family protein [Accumulibacter sp.]HMX21609.1 EcsC family protein [Accumulibacter sp.]HMY05591.1 EcsC family protein [Accumulibacter sp.]HNC17851.1 EcsC family protein [Accumulibacter sp.]
MSDKKHSKIRFSFRAGPRIAEEILDLVGQTPSSTEIQLAHPESRARAISRAAARHAAVTAGGLTLPPGPLGWLTLLPELRALWELQTQLVADIAACYGKSEQLGRTEMIYCLFRHTDAQTIRGHLSQIGRREVVEREAQPDLAALALKIGLHISQRLLGKGLSRFVPVVGAIGAGAYAYFDTNQVAKTAIEFFRDVIDIEGEQVPSSDEPATARNGTGGWWH